MVRRRRFSSASVAARPIPQLAPLEGSAEVEVEDAGRKAIAPLRAPSAPTAEEIEEHEASGHRNYRKGAVRVLLVVGALALMQRMWGEMNMLYQQ